ncbi:alpha-amylase, partial [Phenoliferia sp. Uapishka_3]
MAVILLPLLALSSTALALFPHPSQPAGDRRHFAVSQPQKRAVKANDTIVQAFEWNWASVANECTQWLGPDGYGYVQVSPPQEHIEGSQWWTDYQPVSHRIQSKRGTRAQFASMVATCNAAGVGVIVDAVLNLTDGAGTGVANDVSINPAISLKVTTEKNYRQTYTHYDYSAVPYTSSNFHDVCAGDIDYSNQTSVWTCQLDDLADLRTETAAVQKLEADYLSDLMSLGVSGFRLDAAKSMNPSDIKAILALLSTTPYIVQEVIYGGAVTPNMYTGNGNVHEFRAADSLKTAFVDGGGLSSLLSWPGTGWVSSANAVVFVADHDTERDGTNTNAAAANNGYELASIFLLAQAYGSPEILSGYNHSTYDQGAPLDSDNNALDTVCYQDGWRCEQRWNSIRNMVRFHNAAMGTNQTNAIITSSNRVSFGRGAVGHVAINFESTSWTVTLTTSVRDGTYCEIIHNSADSSTGCSSTTITVSNGKFTVTVGAYDAVAFFVGGSSSASTSSALASATKATPITASSSKSLNSSATTASSSGSSTALVKVTFTETATTSYGQTLVLVGNVSQLGDWTPSSGVTLTDHSPNTTTGTWSAVVALPRSSTFQFKFLIMNSNGTVSNWESDPNRVLTTGTKASNVTGTFA